MILSIPVIIFLLLCIAMMLLITKKLRTHNTHDFYFKRGTRLYDLAFKDDLTHLFNRNAYIRDLKKLEGKKLKPFWFLIFDIDNFKTINDTKGHLFGDKVLIAASNRLQMIFNGKDHTIYRIGGDEFLVMSRDVSEEDIVALLLKLENVEIEKDDFRFSKGYSLVENAGLKHFNAAFDNADKMLYADKRAQKCKAKN